MASKTALILSGGGARGAYQVGVLKGVAELLRKTDIRNPFQILSGVSAGAINSAKLASELEDFDQAVEKLIYLWSQISSENVFKMDLMSLNKISLFGDRKLNSFLDTAPLRALIAKNCDFSKIQKNLDQKILDSLIITSNNYNTNVAVSFIQSRTNKVTWKESRRQAVLSEINVDHVMASSSIPMLFPPVAIEKEFYGDGCVRNNTPCSPSIRMGADRLFVIGVRSQLGVETSQKTTTASHPSMIRIMNTLLNAVLLDSVEQDVFRIQRINELVELAENKTKKSQLQKIEALCISPSEDIGQLARAHAHHLPRLLRMTISTFGHLDEASEIISYLLFNSQFCRKLIEMGYRDAMDSKKSILTFFENAER